MEAAQPLHKGSSNPHGPGKKQKPEKPVVIPLPVTEVANLQTRNPESTAVTAGSANPYSNRMNLNGTIAPVHGSKTIYDKGAEIRYNKFQESLAETGDINHPDTKKLEKSYISTLSISQIRDYHNLKNGTYLPKTLEEQAAAYQAGKNSSEAEIPAASGSDAPVEISPAADIAAESGMNEGFALPEIQEDAVRTTPTSSNSDPNFNHTVGLVKTTAKAKRAHATKEKAETHANAAAAVPAGERKSQAKGRQVEQLDQQRTGSFSASGFKVKLRDKIKSINLPAKQGDAENFKNRNNINAVNGLIKHDVMVSKNSVTGGIETVARQQPDETKVALRTATALPDPKIGSKVSIRATEAMPPKRGDSELSQPIAKSYKSVEQQFAKNHITDEQLAKSNEPDFINALNAKKAANAHAEQAPGEFKNAESKKLEASKREAQGKTNSTMDGMHQSRKGLLDSVTNKQHKAGEKNTAKHQEVVDKLNAIYAETKKTVDGQLGDLETKVAQLFDDGAKKAKDAFEMEVTQKLEAYKARRYGEWYDVRGYGNRIEDAWNKKLPDEVNKYYKQGKDHFMTAMDGVITKIAELVTTRLNAAKASITAGRQKVVSFVKNLPADVRKAVKGDIDAIQGQFRELENSISDKESSLIDSLATKYNNALKEVDELIADIKKRNRGFLAAVEDATVGVAKTIMEIRKTLTELLSGAVSAVMAIVADPIGFLSNLIAGVSQGISNFGTNIWTHLKNGFFGWLTGAMKNISFTLPEDLFSLKGIFSMSSQILGLTWNDIRSIGSSVVGEPVMKVLETGSEKGMEAVQTVRKEGVAGLWEHVKDQFADIKATVMDTIMEIIKTQAIQAGIKFIMSLLTPAGAFVKAAMMIIDLVKFFVQKAAQIMELVKAFTDSIKAIASGNVGAVAKAIENALGRAIPVVIGFLASLAGLGGLADKVVAVIQKIRQRIKNAIVKFWNFVKGKAAKLLSKVGIGKFGKKKDKVDDKHIKNMDSEIAPEPFTMNGKGHTLTFEKGEIYMSTEKAKLSTKIKRSLKYLKDHPTAPELNGKGPAIESRLQVLKGETLTSEKVLKDANGLKENDPKIKTAQKSLDKLSLDIASLGNEYKLIDLAGEYETKELGDMGLKVGQHKLTGAADRQSHHVPEKELRNSLVDFYSTVGKVLNENPDYEDLGKKLEMKNKTINSKFNGYGDKLPAILIHQLTHKDGGDQGIHNLGSQKAAYDNIKKIAEKSGEYQLVIYDEKEQQIRASFREHHFKELVAKVYDLVESRKSNAQIVKEEKGVIIHLKGEEENAIAPIGDKIRNLITTFEGKKASKLEVKENKIEILKTVNKTAEQSFDQTLNISMNALTLALEKHKHLEGDEKARDEALKKIRNLSRDIWSEHIYKPIE